MATSILPFLDAVATAALEHDFTGAVGFHHDPASDTLRVTLQRADAPDVSLTFDGQLVADFADEAHHERVIAVIEERVAGAVATAEAGPR